MQIDQDDTIAAVASAAGGAARAVIRISGPAAVAAATRAFVASGPPPQNIAVAHRCSGYQKLSTPGRTTPLHVPCQLFIWPTRQSYTRQPAVEIHTLGSPPLIDALLRQVCQEDVRLARPGEFTLRSFLAGRIDLTQAEAVLGVIDASSATSLQSALEQLAGGLSGPLNEVRERLLLMLAELEAGLDFADEPLELVSQEALAAALVDAQDAVSAAQRQVQERTAHLHSRRVVLAGPPNAGKSSLFNRLVERYAAAEPRVLVSPVAGTTRDYVEAELTLNDFTILLVDTPGASEPGHIADSPPDDFPANDDPDAPELAWQIAEAQTSRAHLTIVCHAADEPAPPAPAGTNRLLVATKCDLMERENLPLHLLPCSSLTGVGIDQLVGQIVDRVGDEAGGSDSSATDDLSARCASCLERATGPLAAAAALVEQGNQEELVAAELRVALDALGELVGAVYADDVLDRIFSKFCIGK